MNKGWLFPALLMILVACSDSSDSRDDDPARLQPQTSPGDTAQTATDTPDTEQVDTRIGKIELELGVPTQESAQALFDTMDFQRASQAYLWALPTVGFEYVLREQREQLGAKNGDVVIYKGYQGVSPTSSVSWTWLSRAPWCWKSPPGPLPGLPWISGSAR